MAGRTSGDANRSSCFEAGLCAVVLMTGDPRSEEARKGLPRRFLGALHAHLAGAIRATPGLDLIVASDSKDAFTLEGGTRVRSVRCADLGSRVQAAIDTARDWGYRWVLVAAGDVPSLTSELLDRARGLLKGNDCVLAPSRDGGFSLVGLRSDAVVDWQRIPWFTSRVAHALREALAVAGLERNEIQCLDDIDDFPGAVRLVRSLLLPAPLRGLLVGLLRSVGEGESKPAPFFPHMPAPATRLRAPPLAPA